MRVLIVDDNLELLESLAKGIHLEAARVVGADAMLRKPFAPDRLLAMLDSFREHR